MRSRGHRSSSTRERSASIRRRESGKASAAMRKAALLILFALATLLAVTVVPAVPVLAVEGGNREAILALDEGQSYSYAYVNSIYRSSVEERHYRAGDTLHVESAASPEI